MRDCIPVLVLILLAAAFALPYTAGDKVLFPFHTSSVSPWNQTAPAEFSSEPVNHNVGDKHLIIHPDMTFTWRMIDEGRMPLWNPHNFAGIPHQANPLTATTYPLNALFGWLDPFRAYGVIAALHMLLLSIFTYAFLRALSISPGSALLGGIAMGASGWVSVHLHHSYFLHAFTWLPLGLLSVEKLLGDRPRWALMTLALAVGLMFLAGFPQTAVLNCWVLLVWAVVGLIRLARGSGLGFAARRGGLLAAFAAVGLAIAAIQLGPTAEFSTMAGHSDIDAATLHADRLRPATLMTLAMPDFFGHPSEKNVPPDFFERWLLADAPGNNFSERNFHPGLSILLLAMASVLVCRDPRCWLLLAMGAGSVLIATGTPLLGIVSRLPGLNFGSPMRFTQIAAFALPCMGAFCLDGILKKSHVERGPWVRRSVFCGGVGLLVLIAVPLLALWIAPSWSVERATEVVVGEGIDRELGVESLSFTEKAGLLSPSVGRLRTNLTRLFAVLLASWLITMGYLSGRLNGVMLVGGMCAITAVDLGEQMIRFNQPVQSKGLYETESPAVRFLSDNLGDARFIRFGQGNEQTFFTPNAPMALGLNDAQGFRALTPTLFLDFMRTLEPNPYDVGLLNLANVESLSSPHLNMLRVKYAISETPMPSSPWPMVFPPASSATESAAFYVYENPSIVPRAFMAHEVHVLPDEEMLRAFEEMGSTPSAFNNDVWLPELAEDMQSHYSGSKEPGTDSVRVTRDEPGRVTVRVHSSTGGILVLSEQFAPGWRVDVVGEGGERTGVAALRANHTFLGASVESGETTLMFTYDPSSFLLSGVLTGIAIVFLLLIPLMSRLEAPIDSDSKRANPELEI